MDVSPGPISNVTEAAMGRSEDLAGPVAGRGVPDPLSGCAARVAIGVNIEGNREVPGLWTAQNEGTQFWLQLLTELQDRGVKDIFIARVDGLNGFPEAIEAACRFRIVFADDRSRHLDPPFRFFFYEPRAGKKEPRN